MNRMNRKTPTTDDQPATATSGCTHPEHQEFYDPEMELSDRQVQATAFDVAVSETISNAYQRLHAEDPGRYPDELDEDQQYHLVRRAGLYQKPTPTSEHRRAARQQLRCRAAETKRVDAIRGVQLAADRERLETCAAGHRDPTTELRRDLVDEFGITDREAMLCDGCYPGGKARLVACRDADLLGDQRRGALLDAWAADVVVRPVDQLKPLAGINRLIALGQRMAVPR